MGASPEDVAVRLTPQGLEDVSAAFRQILGDINRTSKQGAKSLSVLERGAKAFGGVVKTLGIAAALTGLTAFTRSALSAADGAGKLAAKVGTTTETMSALEFAAKGANVENQELQTGMTLLIKSIGELEQGTDKQVKAFKRLNLEAADFESLDSGEAFALVAEKIGKLGSGAAKTRVVLDLFGKSGANLIPLFNELGSKGFGAVAAEAERFGLIIDTQTATAAAAVNDSFTLMGAQVRGLAIQFLSGLAPTVATVMEDFRNDTAGKGITAAQDFGTATGKMLRDLIFAFQFTGRAVGLFFANLADRIETQAKFNKKVLTGQFRDALALVKEFEKRKEGRTAAFDEDVDALKEQRKASEERAEQLKKDALEKAAERDKALAELRKLEAEQNKAEANKKAKEEAEKIARDKERLEDAANAALVDINQSILEAEGKSREAQILALDAEIAKHREALEEAGRLNEETEALLDKMRSLGVQKIDLGNIEGAINRELESVERIREQIKTDVELKLISEIQGNERLKQLELERIPILKQMVEEARKMAEELGNPDVLAKIEQLGMSVSVLDRNLRSATDVTTRLKEGAFEAFGEGIESILKNAEELSSIEDAFKSLRSSVVNALQDIAAELLATAIKAQLLKALQNTGFGFAGGGLVKAAGGGLITGPGTSTSDSIPALLSDEEYVVRAAAVKRPGVLQFLDYLNRNLSLPRSTPRFKDGGLVGEITPANSGGGIPGFRIVNVVDPNMAVDAMQSPQGEKVILNTLERNPGVVRRLVSL